MGFSLSLRVLSLGIRVWSVSKWGTLAAWFPPGAGLWQWGVVPHFLSYQLGGIKLVSLRATVCKQTSSGP